MKKAVALIFNQNCLQHLQVFTKLQIAFFYGRNFRIHQLPQMTTCHQTLLPKVLRRWNEIFSSLQQFHLIITWNLLINFFLFQPMSSNQQPRQPAPSKMALKRKNDNEVGTICGTQTMCVCSLVTFSLKYLHFSPILEILIWDPLKCPNMERKNFQIPVWTLFHT